MIGDAVFVSRDGAEACATVRQRPSWGDPRRLAVGWGVNLYLASGMTVCSCGCRDGAGNSLHSNCHDVALAGPCRRYVVGVGWSDKEFHNRARCDAERDVDIDLPEADEAWS